MIANRWSACPKRSRSRAAARRATMAIDGLKPRRMLAVFNGTSGVNIIDIFISWASGGMAVRINGVINTTTDRSSRSTPASAMTRSTCPASAAGRATNAAGRRVLWEE